MRVLLLLTLVTQTAAAPPATTRSALAGPIEYRHEVRERPPLHLHVVTIDLTDERVELGAFAGGDDPDADGPWQMTLASVRDTADRHGLDAAVNANFFASRQTITIGRRRVPYFAGNWARAAGWLVCDGRVISSEPAPASLVVGADRRVRVGRFERVPADARHVVSGSQQILTDGNVTARDVIVRARARAGAAPSTATAPASDVAVADQEEDRNTAGDGEPARAPRTAAGVSADGTRLVLLVVDGRRLAHSAGMSETELAHEMLRLGCADALNLDGGGSSTLVMRDAGNGELKVMNRPSDGHDLAVPLSLERAVACVLGVRVRRQP